MKKLTKTTALILSATTHRAVQEILHRRAKVRSRTAKTKVRLKARLLKTAQLRIIQMIKAMKILLKISMGIRRFRMIKTSM